MKRYLDATRKRELEKNLTRARKQLEEIDKLIVKLTLERVDSVQMIAEMEDYLKTSVPIVG